MFYCVACSRTFAEPGIEMNDGEPFKVGPHCGSDRFSQRDAMQVYDPNEDGA